MTKGNGIKRVGDIIQLEKIRSWNTGDTILIKAPTGSGKSFFVTSYLAAHCRANNKKILWLSNRKLLKDQNKRDSKQDSDIITSVNYQQIESIILNQKGIKHFDYIVADECHYFFNDSVFNRHTDYAMGWLLNRKDCIKILCTATGELVDKYLSLKKINVIKYEIEANYNYIGNIYFYNNNKVLEKMLSELPENEKAIYFASTEKALRIGKEFENAEFICSDNNTKYKNYSNKAVKEQIKKNEKFDCQILCSTSVLDNGVNIKDKKVKHIIVDYFDLDTIQQCIGRKRIMSENETINIYIRNRNNKSLNGTLQRIKKIISQAEYFKENGQIEFVNKHIKKTYSSIIDIYNNKNDETKIRVNNMMYLKYKFDIFTIKKLLSEDDGYIKAVLNRFKFGEYKILDDEFDSITLNDKLGNYISKKMFAEEQKEFKKTINKNVLKVIAGSKNSLGYKTINNRFRELELDYKIESKEEKSRKSGKRGKRYWILIKIK